MGWWSNRRYGHGTRCTACRRATTTGRSTASRRGPSSTCTGAASHSTHCSRRRLRCRTRRTCLPVPPPAIRRTCPSTMSPEAKHGSRSRSTASRCRVTTAARHGCSSHTSTSGRAPSSSPASRCSTTTNPASGRCAGITTAAIRGSSSATKAIDGMSDLPTVVVPPVGAWQDATVRDIRVENPRVKTFALQLEQPAPHLAGQHFVVRLTAPDGYTAQRSYSVASPPGDSTSIELTVERLTDGEVSTFLHDDLRVGDTLEVRGPIGGRFVWDGSAPALLIGGGSGIVPLMAMLRLARRQSTQPLAHLLVSARQPSHLIYAGELSADDTTVLFTRVALPES